MRALIDGDVIKYAAGFASDQRIYTIGGEEFEYKKDAVLHAKTHGLKEEDIELSVEAEPVEYCLSSVKKMINSILDRVGADEHSIYITGSGNFRDEVAVTQGYKANRDSSHKPIHYKAIHEYMVDHWDAVVVTGIEADDAMGTSQFSLEADTVICTIDKDLRMIPGNHYNWKSDEVFEVSEHEGMVFFYRQLLTGDTVDNIIGCGKKEEAVYKSGKKKGQKYMKRKGIGPKKAESLIKTTDTEAMMYDTVLSQYSLMFKDEADAMLRENADLLWIRREEGVSWMPPTIGE